MSSTSRSTRPSLSNSSRSTPACSAGRSPRTQGTEYWLIGTGPADEPGIDGGLVRRPVPGPADSPVLNAFPCTVAVESLDATLAKGDELGAVVALPKMAVTGVGWLAYIKDPDGNLLGLLETDPSAA